MKYSTALTSWLVAGMPAWPSRSNLRMIRASSTEMSGSAFSISVSAAVSARMPTPLVSDRAARYSHSTTTRAFMSAYSLK